MMRGSKADEIMTLLFLVLAVGSVVAAFIFNDRRLFIGIAGIAVVIRLLQYALRVIKK